MDGLNFRTEDVASVVNILACDMMRSDLTFTCDDLYAREVERLTPIGDIGKGYTIGSFCSGVGGFDLAASRLGATTAVAAEIKPLAREWFQVNFQKENPELFDEGRFLGDLTKIDHASLPRFDVLVAGFPCQGLARIGKQLGLADPRTTLVFNLADITAAVRPKAFVLENADSLLTHDGGRTLKTVLDLFQGIGYEVRYSTLEATAFGCAAARNRLYIVGIDKARGGAEGFAFPSGTERLLTMSHVVQGACVPEIGYTVRASGLCGTVGESHNHDTYTVDGAATRLTARQAARCLGFPDDFLLPGGRTDGYELMGNSVAVPVVHALLGEVFGHLHRLDAATLHRGGKSKKAKPSAAAKTRAKARTSPTLSAQDLEELHTAAAEIRQCQWQRTSAAITVGKRLAMIKERLPHGTWQPFFKAAVGLTPTMARNWMTIAAMFGGREVEIAKSGLSDTILLEIARAPRDTREALVGRAVEGERFTVRAIKDEIAKAGQGVDSAVPARNVADELCKSIKRSWIKADAKEIAGELAGLAELVFEVAEKVDLGKAPTKTKALDQAVGEALEKVSRLAGIDVLHNATSRVGNRRIVADLKGDIGMAIATLVDLRHGVDAARIVACRDALKVAGFPAAR